jgi:hypothetical protein
MTINKAQGQIIPHVCVYLPEQIFSHEQLYVPLSRGTSHENMKVLVKSVAVIYQTGVYTSNVVYQDWKVDKWCAGLQLTFFLNLGCKYTTVNYSILGVESTGTGWSSKGELEKEVN